jgi:flagellar motor switch protein FliM
MGEKNYSRPEIASQKKVIKLPAAIGDWTTYRPPKVLIKKIKTGLYGFDRLSREDIDCFLMIHYHFTQALCGKMKIDLGMGIEFVSCQAEQTTYINFLRSLSGPAVQAKLTLQDIHDGIQFYCDLRFADSLINHSLGSQDTEPINRGLTETEKNILTTAFSEYLPEYAKVFENIFPPPSFSVIGFPDIEIDRSINPSATFVSFTADISVNDNPAQKIAFGFLGSTLKTLLKHYHEKIQQKPLNFKRLSNESLNRISIPASAVLGVTSLSTTEIKQLEVGDVVSLEQGINSAVELRVGQNLKIQVQPGVSNRHFSTRIAGFKEEEVSIAPPALEEKAAEEKPAAPAETPSPLPPTTEEEAFPAEEKLGEELNQEEFGTEEDFGQEEGLTEDLSEEEFADENFEELPAEESEAGSLGEDLNLDEFTEEETKEGQ